VGSSEAADAAAGSTRVLIVDDNVDFADSLAMLLRMHDYEVRTAYGGVAAVAAAVNFQPHVGLLDLSMPGMSGYDLAKSLRKMTLTQDMLLIAVTGFGSSEDRLRSRQAGFDHHLLKTAELHDIDRLLREHRRPPG